MKRQNGRETKDPKQHYLDVPSFRSEVRTYLIGQLLAQVTRQIIRYILCGFASVLLPSASQIPGITIQNFNKMDLFEGLWGITELREK